MPEEAITGRLLAPLLKKAQKLNDAAVIKLTEDLMQSSRMRQNQKLSGKYRERNRRLLAEDGVNDLSLWHKPKTNEYTEFEQLIIRGDVPTSEVKSKSLISIYQKAKATGDMILAEEMLSIVLDRREDERQIKQAFLDHDWETFGSIYNYPPFYRNRKKLSQWEIKFLMSEFDSSLRTLDHAKHILEVAKKSGNKEYEILAEKRVLYMEHPEELYVVKTRREAIQLINQMLGASMPVPET